MDEKNRDKSGCDYNISENFGGYVSQIIFNNGKSLTTSSSDIVVFVGPNNAGKSQTLKDIYQLCGGLSNDSIVVSELNITKEHTSIKPYLEKYLNISGDSSNKYYNGLGFSIYGGNISSWISEKTFGQFREFLVGYLTTLNRLTICEPAQSIRLD